jgi:hypothetical protein
MNGPGHYRAAEQLLETGTNMSGRPDEIQAVLAAAKVHAQLAQVAATVLPQVLAGNADQWASVIL